MDKNTFFKECRKWVEEAFADPHAKALAKVSLARFRKFVDDLDEQGLCIVDSEGLWTVAEEGQPLVYSQDEFFVEPKVLMRRMEGQLAAAFEVGEEAVLLANSMIPHRPGWVKPSVVLQILQDLDEEVPNGILDKAKKTALCPVVAEDPLTGTVDLALFLVVDQGGRYLVYDLRHDLGAWANDPAEAFDELVRKEVQEDLRPAAIYGTALPRPKRWVSHHVIAGKRFTTAEVVQTVGVGISTLSWGVYHLGPLSVRGYASLGILIGNGITAIGKFFEAASWVRYTGGTREIIINTGEGALLILPWTKTLPALLGFKGKEFFKYSLLSAGLHGFLNGIEGTPPEWDKVVLLSLNAGARLGEKRIPLPVEGAPDAFVIKEITLQTGRSLTVCWGPFGTVKVFDENGRVVTTGFAHQVKWPDGTSEVQVELAPAFSLGGLERLELGNLVRSKIDGEILSALPMIDFSEIPPNSKVFTLAYNPEGFSVTLSLEKDEEGVLKLSYQYAVDGKVKTFEEEKIASVDNLKSQLQRMLAKFYLQSDDSRVIENFETITAALLHYLSLSPKEKPLTLALVPSAKIQPGAGKMVTSSHGTEVQVALEAISSGGPEIIAHEGVHVAMGRTEEWTEQKIALCEPPAYVLTVGSREDQEKLIAGLKFLLGVQTFEEAQVYLSSPDLMIQRMEEVHGRQRTQVYLNSFVKELRFFSVLGYSVSEKPYPEYALYEYDPTGAIGSGLAISGIYMAAYFIGWKLRQGMVNDEDVQEAFEKAGKRLAPTLPEWEGTSPALRGPAPTPGELRDPLYE